MAETFEKYGLHWNKDTEPLSIEFWQIKKGQQWLEERGRSLFFHYKEAQKLLWPEDDHNRWSDLALRRMLENPITVMMGCGASGKTYGMARYALTDWFSFPDITLWLISSTEYRGADLRIWGDLQLLFNRARRLHTWLPGVPLLSLHAITYEEEVDDNDDYFKAARSLKRGMIVVPSKKGNVNVGLSAFVGVRVPRLRHAGSEVQFMASGFLDAYANWYGNSDFRGVCDGNPMDTTDQLCVAGEPADGGWDNFVDTEKTQEWKSKFFGAHVIAFDGRDSPNGDYPDAMTKPKFPYLIGPKKLEAVAATYGKEGWQWFSQCCGKPNKALLKWRIVTRNLCEVNRAMEDVVWEGGEITSVYGLDPNYGGHDRCVGIHVQFGKDVEGNMVLAINPPEIITVRPVGGINKIEPEHQIAKYIQSRLSQLGIPPENCFYDATGKGTMGMAFSVIFGSNSPIAIASGDKATARPVRFDLFEDDGKGGERLKRCDEHYSKLVSEMWFSIREAIESKQVRQLPKDVMHELCLRIYKTVTGNRIEIEPKSTGNPLKPGMKERTGFSPDLADALAIAVEGARQKNFQIKRLGSDVPTKPKSNSTWLLTAHESNMALIRSRELRAA